MKFFFAVFVLGVVAISAESEGESDSSRFLQSGLKAYNYPTHAYNKHAYYNYPKSAVAHDVPSVASYPYNVPSAYSGHYAYSSYPYDAAYDSYAYRNAYRPNYYKGVNYGHKIVAREADSDSKSKSSHHNYYQAAYPYAVHQSAYPYAVHQSAYNYHHGVPMVRNMFAGKTHYANYDSSMTYPYSYTNGLYSTPYQYMY